MGKWLSYALIFFQILLVLSAVQRERLLQVLPSITWFTTMFMPFFFVSDYFPEDSRRNQFIGILIITLVLQFTDLIAISVVKNFDSQHLNLSIYKLGAIFWFSISCCLMVPIMHYMLAGNIPLLDQIFGAHTPEEISKLRENYSKELDLPYLFKILPNLIFTIFGPYVVLVLVKMRRYISAASIFLWCLFYALSSSADLPAIILLGATLIALMLVMTKPVIRIATFLILSTVLTISVSGIVLKNELENGTRKCSLLETRNEPLGDTIRGCDQKGYVWVNPVVDRIAYRVFLTPVEVSNEWYRFYGDGPSPKRSIKSLLDRQESQSAANQVGNWAYVQKFPDKYLTSNSSYASIDADGFSFGWSAVLFSGFALILIRVIIILGGRSRDFRSQILASLMLSQLVLFPFQASIQAILFPQGLGFLLLIYFGQYIYPLLMKLNPFTK